MMKNTDVMIDDWVLYDGKPYRVAEIGGMLCLDTGDGDYIFAEFDEVKPIPITPEILEKNGINHSKNCGYIYDDYNSILVCYDTWERRLKIIKGLNMVFDSGEYADIYVNTIQHALRLCEIEKEIVLN